MSKTIKKSDLEEQAYKFLTPEQIDTIIKNRIKLATPSGRKRGMNNSLVAWSEYEKDLRRQVIIDYLRQGLSKVRVLEEIRNRWGVSRTCAQNYLSDAAETLVQTDEKYIEANRNLQIERLEGLLEDALEDKDRKSALSALEQLNKIGGLYTTTTKVEMAPTIKFTFGGAPEEEGEDDNKGQN